MESQVDEAAAHRKRFEMAAEICAKFKKTLSGFKVYTRGHEILEGFHAEVFEFLDAYLREYESLALEFTSLEITMEGKALITADRWEEAISHPLFLDGAQRLVFLEGLTEPRLRRLVDMWNTAFEIREESEQTFTTKFWEEDFEFIKLVSIETFSEGQEDDDDTDERANEAQLNALMTQLSSEQLSSGSADAGSAPRLMRVTRNDLRVLQMDAIANLTAADLERQDVASRPPVNGLDDAETHALLAELAADAEDPVTRVIRAIIDVSNLATPQEYQRLSEICADVLAALARSRRFQSMAKVIAQTFLFARSEPLRIDDRCRALEQLLEALEAPKVLEPVLRSLDDPDRAESAMVVLQYVQRGANPILLAYLGKLDTEEGHERLREMLTRLKVPGEMIATHLGDADALNATELLGLASGLSDSDGLLVCRAGLQHSEVSVRREALRSLRPEQALEMRDALRALVTDDDLDLRRTSLELLTAAGDRDMLNAVWSLLGRKDVDGPERRGVYSAMVGIGGRSAAQALGRELARQTDAEAKVVLAQALGQLADPSSIPVLDEAMSGWRTAKELKAACKEALARIEANAQGQR